MKNLRVGFLGLGTMGAGMARRLLKAGYGLSVYNRNVEKTVAFSVEGARVAESPEEAARGSDVVISMLADDVASRAVWFGEKGALSGAEAGAVLIECGTVSVSWIRELGDAAEGRGCRLLDAPVTGTKPHAANGELTFLVGGDGESLEKVRPLLAAMSKEIVHLGPLGSGAALKLVNNFLCGVQAAAFAEANALVHRAGLDAAKALPVLLNGAPGSPVVKTVAGRHANRDYSPNFQLRLMAKDLAYAIAEGKRHGVGLPSAVTALNTFSRAINAELGDQDMAAVIKFLETVPGSA